MSATAETLPLQYASAERAGEGASVSPSPRVESVDALRAVVMFTMIFVNDIARVPHVPAWMKHFRGPEGITFVDLVFPAFQFIVGLSIPLAIGPRLARGEPVLKILLHVVVRTLALLTIGIMMVNGDLHPDASRMPISANAWVVLMYTSAILMCCSIAPGGKNAPPESRTRWSRMSFAIRAVGVCGIVALAMIYRASNGRAVLELHPFFIRHAWYGILGVIGWGYLVASIAYLLFRDRRTPLLACTALVMSLYGAGDVFKHFWIAHHVNIPSALGSHAALSVAGVLFGTIFVTPDTQSLRSRIRFTAMFALTCVLAAILIRPEWGLSKERGTPAWAFWACAATASLWLLFHLVERAAPPRGRQILHPLAVAGRNVLLAYLFSEMMESVLTAAHLADHYARLADPTLTHAVTRSASCAASILLITTLLNRAGFSLKI